MRYDHAGRCAADGAALAETTDALLGCDVGSYRLVKLVGRGGMGRVYLGVQPAIGGRVAIKVLSEDACEEPDAVARFIAEARAVNRIRHESIVGVHDFLQLPDGRPAIVMELVEGQTLRDLIELRVLPLGGVVNAMLDVLGALAAAHAIGIVHRDLKPDNIIIAPSGRAKLLDFGIAKLAVGEPGLPRTRTGAVLGTPHYMSPEQIQGEVLDARSDLYSLGVLLFETLARQRPFEGVSDFELMMAHVQAPVPSVRALRPDVPVELEQVLAGALAKRRADRFRSASAMATALHAASAAVPADGWRSLLDPNRVVSRAMAPALAVGTPNHDEIVGRATVRDRPSARRTPRDHAPVGATVRDRPSARGGLPAARQRTTRLVVIGAIGALAATALVIAAIVVYARRDQPGADPVTIDLATHANDGPAPPAVPLPPDANSEQVSATKQLNGDPRHFDAIAYLATALGFARETIPEAELITMITTSVRPGGLADLALAGGHAVYVFRSARPDARHACHAVTVTVDDGGVHVYAATNVCGRGFRPKCSMAQVWKRAVDRGVRADATATFTVMQATSGAVPTWVVDGDGHGATLRDDCDAGADPEPAVEPTKPVAAGHGREPIRTEPDYDIHRLDLLAWLPHGERAARAMASDARMYDFASMGMSADGHIDLQPPKGTRHEVRSTYIDYRTSSAPCRVRVVLTYHHVLVFAMGGEVCTDDAAKPAPALPKCTLAQVWARGIAKSNPDDTKKADLDTAIIRWDGDKRIWTFQLWDRGGQLELDDRC